MLLYEAKAFDRFLARTGRGRTVGLSIVSASEGYALTYDDHYTGFRVKVANDRDIDGALVATRPLESPAPYDARDMSEIMSADHQRRKNGVTRKRKS